MKLNDKGKFIRDSSNYMDESKNIMPTKEIRHKRVQSVLVSLYEVPKR